MLSELDPEISALRHEPSTPRPEAQDLDPTAVLAQGLLICAASAFRLWQGRADISLKYSIEALQACQTAMQAPTGWLQRTLIDIARGYFRELTEIQDKEVLRLHTELEDATGIPPSAGPNDGNLPYIRRWRTKS